jgi:hypothetical protein
MLDVHPAHHAATTWRDFFIHITTIVLGLLIAIGLEQTVEYFHHRHQVAETRAALREEKAENIRLYHQNVEYHIMTMAYLHNNLRIFLYLRDHPGTPQEKLPGILYWPIFTQRPQETVWSTAGQTGVLDLMPRAEVSSIAATYANLDYAWQTYQPVVPALTACTTYYAETPDITQLSAAEIATEIGDLKRTIALEAVYGDTLSVLGKQSDFGPYRGWWRMIPYFTMKDYYEWAHQHPELSSPSQDDIDRARAFAGLPPEDHDQAFHYFTDPRP